MRCSRCLAITPYFWMLPQASGATWKRGILLSALLALDPNAQGVRDASSYPMILLVDDDETVRETSADMLEELGHSVLQAADGNQALALLDEHREIEVLVTDVRMPGMSGLELADIVGRRFLGLRIILISGYFLPQPISRRFLQKPFRIRDLDLAIRAELAVLGQI